MMVVNCFCRIVDRRKALGLISSWNHPGFPRLLKFLKKKEKKENSPKKF